MLHPVGGKIIILRYIQAVVIVIIDCKQNGENILFIRLRRNTLQLVEVKRKSRSAGLRGASFDLFNILVGLDEFS